MKTHKALCLAMIVSMVLAFSVQAGNHGGGRGGGPNSAAAGGRPGYASSAGYRYGGPMGMHPMPGYGNYYRGSISSFGQRRFTPGTFNGSNNFARFQNNRNFATVQGSRANHFNSVNNSNRGFNNSHAGNHVFAHRSADWHHDWDHNHDHWWHGHCCRFVNGSWVVFDVGFWPWYGWPYDYYYPYGYYYPYSYPYGGYGYYPGYPQGYDQGYNSNYYDQGGYNKDDDDHGNPNYDNRGSYNSRDEGSEASVADAQDKLAREGYYHGQIDGVFGPETRHALFRFQSDHGLGPTGYLTMETRQSLGIQQGTQY